MKKPRNVKQAIENNYIVISIYNKGAKRIRLTLEKKINNNNFSVLIFWINRDYFKRTYSKIYDKFSY